MSPSILITGATRGLGLRCAEAVRRSRPDQPLVLAVRNEASGQQVARSLGGPVQVEILDLASLESVRALASRLAGQPLNGLICNAGLQFTSRTQTSPEGFEATFAINHLGHYLLTRLLLAQMTETSRILFVASGTHDPLQRTGMPAPIWRDPEQLAQPGNGDDAPGIAGRRAYSTSKLLNVMTTYGLNRRLAEDPRAIAVNAFDPGFMPGPDSGLARAYPPMARIAWNLLLPLLRFVMPRIMTPSESGADLARLAVDPAYGGQTGLYFEGPRAIASSVLSRDQDKQDRLWEVSAKLCGLPS